MRKAASRGNLSAIKSIQLQWELTNAKEAVFWLHEGIKFGHPWCADRLAEAYRYGGYGFEQDPVMEAKYRKIAEDLRKQAP